MMTIVTLTDRCYHLELITYEPGNAVYPKYKDTVRNKAEVSERKQRHLGTRSSSADRALPL